MALLVECPQCKRRNPQKEKACKGCGFLLAKHSGRVWWIEYYDHDKRLRRERIGPNKAAAEQKYREVKSVITKGRYIKKSPEAKTTFKALADWYLNLPEVKANRSYKRDKELLAKLLPHLGDMLLKDITPSMVEEYKQTRPFCCQGGIIRIFNLLPDPYKWSNWCLRRSVRSTNSFFPLVYDRRRIAAERSEPRCNP
jgi:hypothetical protein